MQGGALDGAASEEAGRGGPRGDGDCHPIPACEARGSPATGGTGEPGSGATGELGAGNPGESGAGNQGADRNGGQRWGSAQSRGVKGVSRRDGWATWETGAGTPARDAARGATRWTPWGPRGSRDGATRELGTVCHGQAPDGGPLGTGGHRVALEVWGCTAEPGASARGSAGVCDARGGSAYRDGGPGASPRAVGPRLVPWRGEDGVDRD